MPKMLYAGTAHGSVWQYDFTAEACDGDFYHDGDVDGLDLFDYITYPASMSLADFAADFGRTNCP